MTDVKIGLLTIGQAPRADGLARDVGKALGNGFTVVERGALDGLQLRDIERMAPEPADYRLITLLKDGSSVEIAKRHLLPRLQEQITALEAEGTAATLLMCTGTFPAFRHKRALLAPQEALYGIVQALAAGGRIGALTPLTGQVEQAREKWQAMGVPDTCVVPANPYGDRPVEAVAQAASRLQASGATVAFLDCFGYTTEMRAAVESEFHGAVVLARTMAARIAADLAPVAARTRA